MTDTWCDLEVHDLKGWKSSAKKRNCRWACENMIHVEACLVHRINMAQAKFQD
jgi:hypothetical protein